MRGNISITITTYNAEKNLMMITIKGNCLKTLNNIENPTRLSVLIEKHVRWSETHDIKNRFGKWLKKSFPPKNPQTICKLQFSWTFPEMQFEWLENLIKRGKGWKQTQKVFFTKIKLYINLFFFWIFLYFIINIIYT